MSEDTPESVRELIQRFQLGGGVVAAALERYAKLLEAIRLTTLPLGDQDPSGMAMMMAKDPTIGEVIKALNARVAQLEAKLSGVAQWVRYPESQP